MLQMNPGGTQISSDGDDRMGAKIKTQKAPWTKKYPLAPLPPKKKQLSHTEFPSLKISRRH